MASPSAWKDRKSVVPPPFRARMGGLLFALAVVVAAIWLLSRVQ